MSNIYIFRKKNIIQCLKIIKYPYPYGKPPKSKYLKRFPYEDEYGRIIIPDPDYIDYKDDHKDQINDKIFIDDIPKDEIPNKKPPHKPLKKIPNKKLPPIWKEPKPKTTKKKLKKDTPKTEKNPTENKLKKEIPAKTTIKPKKK